MSSVYRALRNGKAGSRWVSATSLLENVGHCRMGKIRLLAGVLAMFLVLAAPSAFGEEEEAFFSQAELDQMLAPVALYPDALLSQILVASTYPLEVVEAARWARNNPDLEGQEAVEAVDEKDWDLSVKALVAVPEVVAFMSDELEWTQRMGDAFLIQEEQVMDTIQNLREKAYEAGNLGSSEHVTVKRERNVIVIEQADPQVVYVPYYRTRVVYGTWWRPYHPPVYWAPPHRPYGRVTVVWSRPYRVSSAFYYSSFHWPERHVIVNVHHHHRTSPHSRFHRDRSSSFKRWTHNPKHRRGVAYRNERLTERFGRSGASRPVRDVREARRTWQHHYAERYRGTGDRSSSDFNRRHLGRRSTEARSPSVRSENRQGWSQRRSERVRSGSDGNIRTRRDIERPESRRSSIRVSERTSGFGARQIADMRRERWRQQQAERAQSRRSVQQRAQSSGEAAERLSRAQSIRASRENRPGNRQIRAQREDRRHVQQGNSGERSAQRGEARNRRGGAERSRQNAERPGRGSSSPQTAERSRGSRGSGGEVRSRGSRGSGGEARSRGSRGGGRR